MTGILAEIVAYKREFVEACTTRIAPANMKARARDAAPPRGFAAALGKRSENGCALIAEIKTASPSKGLIREGFDPADVARVYECNGAACISVLTDERYFRGSIGRLAVVRETVGIPVLRKDFIIDPYQVFEARSVGADAVLLIAACLGDDELSGLMEISSQLGMDVLLEVHDEREMERAVALNALLVGINNRDLATFATDLAVTERLARMAPAGALVVSESGIRVAEDVRRVHAAGARAVLVGETIMREADMAAKVRELAGAV